MRLVHDNRGASRLASVYRGASRFAIPAWAGFCAVLAGCAHSSARGPSPAASRARLPEGVPRGDATGTWDWMLRSPNEQGDLRVEQEEWHLQQQGARLFGYYDRQVLLLSQDQRPFQCNGALGFTKLSRVRVSGEIHGAAIALQETAAEAQPGPCDGGQRNLMGYTGELSGNSLMLRFPPGGMQYLARRRAGAPTTPLSSRGPLSLTPSDPGAASLPGLSGVWEWELSTVDSEGDLRTEREEWHITEHDADIAGYYERTVHRTRTGGAFPCSGSAEIEAVTHYTLRGQRFGDHVTVSEVDFKARPGPCDNALRRLDTYQGDIAPGGQEMVLSWGPGNQVLKRKQ